jgi:hypothetical protein
MAYAKVVGKLNLYNLAKRNGVAMRTLNKYGTLSNDNAGLAGWWKMDEGTGTAIADSSGNENNGTRSGSSWVAGKIKGCLQFANTLASAPDFITVPDSASVSITGDITLAAWVYVDAFNMSQCIFSKQKSGSWEAGPCFFFIQASDGKLYLRLGDNTSGSQANSLSTGAVSATTWTHVAITVSGTSVAFYINGSAAGTATNTATRADNGTSLLIGRSQDSGQAMNGRIDDARIYNRALSATDIAALYAVTAP